MRAGVYMMVPGVTHHLSAKVLEENKWKQTLQLMESKHNIQSLNIFLNLIRELVFYLFINALAFA